MDAISKFWDKHPNSLFTVKDMMSIEAMCQERVEGEGDIYEGHLVE